ncbi:hypothetical protein [Marinitoga sp. 38H-ov]|uniref:hypothetical protein n=1 Tax=Marinitoga sp. 38H-ov TaxID=1755814 RepID=UPI0013EBE850|nr:hypothetical protein [Marinitoga sp. 38H-ov]KAF2955451.1 hypothetical protein AS160_10165 [Marinitoga sp. 38H-ov]
MRTIIFELYNLVKRRETFLMVILTIIISLWIPWSLKNMPDFWSFHGNNLEEGRYIWIDIQKFSHVWYIYIASFGMFLYPLYGISIGEIVNEIKYKRIHTVLIYTGDRTKYMDYRFLAEFILLLFIIVGNLMFLYIGWRLNISNNNQELNVLNITYIFVSIFFGTLLMMNISKYFSLKFFDVVKSYSTSLILFILLIYLSFTSIGKFFPFFLYGKEFEKILYKGIFEKDLFLQILIGTFCIILVLNIFSKKHLKDLDL